MPDTKTYQQIETKVLKDLDLEDETFIGTGVDSEMMGYCNEAIKTAEGIIHELCEDYFLCPGTAISLVAAQADYALPTDIYADKIRKLIYANGPTIYDVKRMQKRDGFVEIAVENLYNTSMLYSYLLVNSLSAGRKIRIVPTPQSAESSVITPWYIREARQVAALSDEVDIPEFHSFIEKYMKVQCLAKEMLGSPSHQMAVRDLEKEESRMIASLTNRVPDEDDEIEMDLSFYRDHV